MQYKRFIQDNFLIDRADTGELVPFVFNKVQAKYYDELVKDYDIEAKGISVAIRENILKARREGFSSVILAIFCADDIRNDNPTETTVISYKEDATDTFKRRYRTYALSFFAKFKLGFSVEEIKGNSRQRPLVTARQTAMYVVRELTDLSYPAIARLFGGRDHTTVIHAVDKTHRVIKERKEVYEQVTQLIKKFKTS